MSRYENPLPESVQIKLSEVDTPAKLYSKLAQNARQAEMPEVQKMLEAMAAREGHSPTVNGDLPEGEVLDLEELRRGQGHIWAVATGLASFLDALPEVNRRTPLTVLRFHDELRFFNAELANGRIVGVSELETKVEGLGKVLGVEDPDERRLKPASRGGLMSQSMRTNFGVTIVVQQDVSKNRVEIYAEDPKVSRQRQVIKKPSSEYL